MDIVGHPLEGYTRGVAINGIVGYLESHRAELHGETRYPGVVRGDVLAKTDGVTKKTDAHARFERGYTDVVF